MIISEKFPVKKILVVGMLLVLGSLGVKAQCLPQVRKYATRQHDFSIALLTLGGSISNAASVVDGNPKNSSSLNFAVGALGLTYAEQVVDFNPDPTATTNTNSPTYLAGRPITLKLSLPAGLLGVGTGIEVQAITNLRNPVGLGGWTYTPVGEIYSGATLLSLLSGAGDIELTLTPNVAYQGVRVRLTSTLGLLATTGFFHAYVLENGPTNSTCNENIDVLAGVKAGNLANVATATGEVLNKWDAIDNDPVTTYTTLNVGAQVLSEVFHTTIFKTLAQPGDAVQMIIQKPGGGLLDLNLLNGFSIRMYNGNTAIGTAFSASSGLSLTLLPGSTTGNEKYKLTIPVPKIAGAFDRVELKIGGLLSAELTPGIRIYDVKHIILPKTAIDGVNVESANVCFGSSAALSVSELQDCTTYNWYANAVGGNSIHAGTTPFTPLAASLIIGENTFYLEAKRTNCTDVIPRLPVTIKVNPLPTFTPTTANVCKGTLSTKLEYIGTNLVPTTTYNIIWNSLALTAGFLNISNAPLTGSPIIITVPSGVNLTTYTGSMIIKNGNTCSSAPIPININVHNIPPSPIVSVQ
jgi:hypothetical protein